MPVVAEKLNAMAPKCPIISAQTVSSQKSPVLIWKPPSPVAHPKRTPAHAHHFIYLILAHSYVTGLEDRMEALEALLKQLRPDEDFSQELGPPVLRGSWKDPDEPRHLMRSSSSDFGQPEHKAIPRSSTGGAHRRTTHLLFDQQGFSSSEESNFDLLEIENLSGTVQKLTLRGDESLAAEPPDAQPRFHGRSSAISLIEAAQRFKMMHLLDSIDGSNDHARRGTPDSAVSDPNATAGSSIRRPEFWAMPLREREWEDMNIDSPELISSVLAEFPPPDLSIELVKLYFSQVNSRFPLLHRPTFERQWKEKLHHTNVWFAAVCLGIFCVASRWSNDVRVIPEGALTETGEPDWSLAGWKYCDMGKVGIRKAQDVGAHRKKVYHSEPSVDEELWKRAFWCLIVFDRVECTLLGRGCGVGEEDFDVGLPLEVDDEYWETDDPSECFKQPKGIPAQVSVFNQVIKLSQMMAFAIKTLYAVDKSKIFFGLGPSAWRKEVVDQMDGALQEWLEGVPEHLQWSKQREGSTHMVDAATLQSTYHLIEMLIYQAFIPSPYSRTGALGATPPPSRQSLLPFSALDKCVEAARSCARICETQTLQSLLSWPIYIYAAQVCSSMLLVKIWDIKMQEKTMRAQGLEDIKPPIQVIEPLMADVKVFLRILEWAEPRWGFIRAFLQDLRACLPGAPGFGTTCYPEIPVRGRPRISEHVVPPSTKSGVPASHSPHRPWQWDQSPGLARIRTSFEQSRPTYGQSGGLSYDYSSPAEQLQRPREHTDVPLLKPGSAHSSYDSDYTPLLDDSLTLPSPFDQMKALYPGGAAASASPLPFLPHQAQRSLPYLSSAMRQVPFAPSDRNRNHRHRTGDGGLQYDINMVFDPQDSHQSLDDYPRAPGAIAPRSSTGTHYTDRTIF
ncbi:hypothetical protein H0H81_002931 [Sphagnurus paluster]|uniref:Xylanolytic transcriptional activator regulatory domain-containing protein n=1 Tax=Sphagnurus paluster TaxID=117069 RepID=A0A9P7FW16_9AGAR|nr:hypothetical protein H0H81_002931 [Sphagnurus paluster]